VNGTKQSQNMNTYNWLILTKLPRHFLAEGIIFSTDGVGRIRYPNGRRKHAKNKVDHRSKY
jgi:hypothetical protein